YGNWSVEVGRLSTGQPFSELVVLCFAERFIAVAEPVGVGTRRGRGGWCLGGSRGRLGGRRRLQMHGGAGGGLLGNLLVHPCENDQHLLQAVHQAAWLDKNLLEWRARPHDFYLTNGHALRK